MKALLSAIVGSVSLAAAPAISHHSFAAEFDLNRPIDFTGTVTRVDWTNPHAWLYVDVADEDGNVRNWAIELLGINTLVRRGWTRESVKLGDVVSVAGFAARDGGNKGNASLVTMTSTGERLWDSARQ